MTMMHLRRNLRTLALLTLTTAVIAPLLAQSTADTVAPVPAHHGDRPDMRDTSGWVLRTYHLSNVQSGGAADEILVALRNMLTPQVKIYLVGSSEDIQLFASPEQQSLAQKIISELDKPGKVYRITYTVAELDGGKVVGTQHISVVAAAGQRTTLKEGSKIPIVTNSGGNDSQTQFTYLDVGMNLDATVNPVSSGVILNTKVEQSSIADNPPLAGVNEPVVRQTVLDGEAMLSFGKALMLGSVDVPNSTRHYDISVMVEPIQ
jgi:hypothetical protein